MTAAAFALAPGGAADGDTCTEAYFVSMPFTASNTAEWRIAEYRGAT
jgi:hypothetical protein